MASIPMAESTTNFAKAQATAGAVKVEKEVSEASGSSSVAYSTTLRTLASSSEPYPSKTTISTTAAPVVKTTYETMFVTEVVYVTADAQDVKRSRHYGKHGVKH